MYVLITPWPPEKNYSFKASDTVMHKQAYFQQNVKEKDKVMFIIVIISELLKLTFIIKVMTL